MRCYIDSRITDDKLIEQYGFTKVPWGEDKHLLECKDKDGLGLEVWWKDRSVKIILGVHGEYGICPIPDVLIQLFKDKVIVVKEGDED